MSPDNLVYMASQIGRFFENRGPEQAVAGTVEYIRQFRHPRMRAEIVAHLHFGGAGLDPNIRAALDALPTPSDTRLRR